MVVRITMVAVSSGVICIWRVVCGERGSGMESRWGLTVGDVVVEATVVGVGDDWGMAAAA